VDTGKNYRNLAVGIADYVPPEPVAPVLFHPHAIHNRHSGGRLLQSHHQDVQIFIPVTD